MSFYPPGSIGAQSLRLWILVGLAAVYVGIVVAAWLVLVPSFASPQTFVWASAASLVILVSAVATITNAQATRSIAHVLYDVENQAPRVR